MLSKQEGRDVRKDKALVLVGAFRKGFFERLPLLCVNSLSPLPLSPTPSLPHSSERGAGSSKETLVDSRKSGCLRSDKNLVGVSVWVEPVEEHSPASAPLVC